MADVELLCNGKKCRKSLTSVAWVTSCSHVFCAEDVSKHFTCLPTKCPACDNALPTKLDVVKVDLQPSEQFKSMVLAGLRPDIILDITARALSFWTYQTHQEKLYQEATATRLRESLHQMEVYQGNLLGRLRAEVQNLRRQLEVTKRDLEKEAKRAEELAERLTEKTRQYQKLQAMYDSMRRSTLSSSMMAPLRSTPHPPTTTIPSFTMGPRPLDLKDHRRHVTEDAPKRFDFSPTASKGLTPCKRANVMMHDSISYNN